MRTKGAGGHHGVADLEAKNTILREMAVVERVLSGLANATEHIVCLAKLFLIVQDVMALAASG
jgi:hypothetical protein